jgi:hypothetical protein
MERRRTKKVRLFATTSSPTHTHPNEIHICFDKVDNTFWKLPNTFSNNVQYGT